MKLLALFVISAVFFLPVVQLHAADSDAVLTSKATALLKKLQADISPIKTTSLITLTNFKSSEISGNSLRDGWSTYYRYGIVRFRDPHGGFDITPQYDSISVLDTDSLYLSLTVASRDDKVPANRTFDLAPYLPGCRLYVYYRQNLFGQAYENQFHVTPTEKKIYQTITHNLATLGVTAP